MDEQRCSFPPPLKVSDQARLWDRHPTGLGRATVCQYWALAIGTGNLSSMYFALTLASIFKASSFYPPAPLQAPIPPVLKPVLLQRWLPSHDCVCSLACEHLLHSALFWGKAKHKSSDSHVPPIQNSP